MVLQEGAVVDIVVKLGIIKVIQKEYNLCEEACVIGFRRPERFS